MIKNLKARMKNKKGFTLVELIVVIVIILVLAAVMVPSLMKYVEKANQANCKADAATVLAQVQADYAASLANSETGISLPEKVNNVTITKTNTLVNAGTMKAGAGDTAPFAKYCVDTTGDLTGEITSFGFNNGKYIAVWTLEKGWEITK